MPRFRRVGGALLAYALLRSREQGFDGRLGLHVADDQALGFYQHINSKYCGGTLFQPVSTGVAGPTLRGQQEQTKPYLETTEAGASRWLKEYESE